MNSFNINQIIKKTKTTAVVNRKKKLVEKGT